MSMTGEEKLMLIFAVISLVWAAYMLYIAYRILP
jgi:hypothetical protein